MHTADDSYKYHRARVRSDNYAIRIGSLKGESMILIIVWACIFIKLYITVHSGSESVVVAIICYSHWSSQARMRDTFLSIELSLTV